MWLCVQEALVEQKMAQYTSCETVWSYKLEKGLVVGDVNTILFIFL